MAVTSEAHFRVGQVAKKFGVSSYHIRKLLEAGLVDGELTASQQWRIPASEIARFEKSGLPPTPQTAGRDTEAGHRLPPPPAGSRQGHPALLAEPSEEVIEAAEQVVVLENEVRGLGLRRQKEEGLDWFRKREELEEERLAAEQEAELERAEAERRREARAERESRWLEYALNSVPYEARGEVETEIHEQVRAALSQVRLSESDAVVQRIVDAVTTKLLRPWQRHKEIRKAVEEARDSLPYQLKGFSWSPTQWEVRAREAAAAAMAKLRPEASYAEMRATAINAVEPVIAEFEHQQARNAIVNDLARHLPGATTAELELAKEAVALSLGHVPVGTSERIMQEVRDRVLAPLKEVIGKRQAEEQAQQRRQQDQALRQGLLGSVSLPWDFPGDEKQEALAAVAEALDKLPEGTARGELEKARDEALRPFLDAHAQRKRKAQLIEDGLRGIFGYVLKLEQDWDFDGKTAWTLEPELREPIRKRLTAELSGDELPEEVGKRVRRLVREQLGITAGPTTQRQRAEAHPRPVGEGRTVRTGARV